MDQEIQTQQETSISEATPAQETSDNQSATSQPANTGEPTKATDGQQENWEYSGDRNAVPDPFKKYVAGLDRYVSKKDQSRIELEKKVKEYETKLASIQENQNKTNTGSDAPQEPQVTQEEAEAIMLGDAKTLQKVIQREAKHLLEANVAPKEAAMSEKLSAMELRQREIDAAEVIKSFTEINPDFSELLKSPVGEYMVDAARKGADIETIHKNAQAIKQYFYQDAETKRKADIEKKKAGTVAGKSIPGTPDVVFADDENHAKRLAIELTLKGDKRHVRIKSKK